MPRNPVSQLKKSQIVMKKKEKKPPIKKMIGTKVGKNKTYSGYVYIDAWLLFSKEDPKKPNKGWWRVTEILSLKVKKASEDDIVDEITAYLSDKYDSAIRAKFNWSYTDIINRISLKRMIYDMPIEDVRVLPLKYDIKANNAIIRNHCVYDYLEENAKQMRIVKALKKIKDKMSWTVHRLINFLEDNNVNNEIYDQWWNKVSSFKQDEHRKIWRFIVANRHLYPLETYEYKNLKKKDYKNIKKIKLIKNNSLIHHVKQKTRLEWMNTNVIMDEEHEDIKEIILNRYISNDVLYVDEKAFNAYKLYKELNMKILLSTNWSFTTPFFDIAEKNKLYSVFVSNWNTPKPVHMAIPSNNPNIVQIDLNGAHTGAGINLEYFPVIDETCYVYKYDGRDIEDTTFYYVKDVHPDYLDCVNNGVCSGYRLKHFKRFATIQYFQEPKLYNNPFSKLLKEMANKDMSLTKFIFNIFIGCCQKKGNTYGVNSVVVERAFLDDKEADNVEYMKYKDIFVALQNKENKKRYNETLLPFAHYVVDYCFSIVYSKVKELQKNGLLKKLIRIKTDSISYIGTLPDDLNKEIHGWKREDYNSSKNIIGRFQPYTDKKLHKITKFQTCTDILGDNYAGCGKTYTTINEIIPTIVKYQKDIPHAYKNDFIILCEHHNPLVDYRKKKYEAHTFASMKMQSKIDAKYIIIDEAGLTEPHNWKWLYLNINTDQNIIAFGDSGQLPPVSSNVELNPLKHLGIRSMFEARLPMLENYRNDYTREQYDQMKDGTYIPTFELERHNIISECNICYFNDTCKKINDSITKDWTDRFGDIKVKVGGKLICKSNKLIKKGLTNKMILEIVKYGNTIVLSDEITEYELTKDEFLLGEFKHAYAITLYCAQGKSIPLKDISFHDINRIKKVKGGLYVAYSRIQTK